MSENSKASPKPLPANPDRQALAHSIAAYTALNFSPREIASTLAIPVSRVRTYLKAPDMKQLCRDKRDEMNLNFEKILQTMIPASLEQMRELIGGQETPPNVRLGAIRELWDRTKGKAVQPVEERSSTIKDVFEALDKAGIGMSVKEKPARQELLVGTACAQSTEGKKSGSGEKNKNASSKDPLDSLCQESSSPENEKAEKADKETDFTDFLEKNIPNEMTVTALREDQED